MVGVADRLDEKSRPGHGYLFWRYTTLHPENFVGLTSLDSDNPNDKMDAYDPETMSVFDPDATNKPNPFVQVEMPATTQELVDYVQWRDPLCYELPGIA